MTAFFIFMGWFTAFTLAFLQGWNRGRHAKALEQKDNAIKVWQQANVQSQEEIRSLQSVVAHMHMEIEGLTPKRVNGRFASKRNQTEFKSRGKL
jgi:hypothetical protein